MIPFVDPTTVMFGKLILAALLGVLVGTERAIAHKNAGTRTFSLVALGSCMFVLISNYVGNAFSTYAYAPGYAIQPTYMAAAIISGVGFIGAGLMIMHGNATRGITTAAGLWVSAAVGTAVGFGMYSIAIFTTVITLIIFTGMWFIEHRFMEWFEHEMNVPRKKSRAPKKKDVADKVSFDQ